MKEFGKLTLAQLRDLLGHLMKFREHERELLSAFRAASPKRLDELLADDCSWSALYELDFITHMATAAVVLGMTAMLTEVASAADPQQALLERMQDDAPVEPDSTVSKAEVIGMTISVGKTLNSLMTYGRSLSSLVADVRDRGDLKALFEAVRIDRAAVSCPSIAAHIAKAELVGDEAFFVRLRNALKGPSRKHLRGPFDQLRYAFALLREFGIGGLSDGDLEQLFVHDLALYADAPSARKNLRAMYHRSRMLSTI